MAVRDRVVSRQITRHSSVSKARHIQMSPDGGDPGLTWRLPGEPTTSPIIDLVIAARLLTHSTALTRNMVSMSKETPIYLLLKY